jgi:hypothetical protein
MMATNRLFNAALPPLAAVVVLAVVASMTFLAWAERVNGDAVIAIFSAIVGGVLTVTGARQQSSNGGQG